MFPQENPLEISNILEYLETNLICWAINETKKYSTKYDNFLVLYGISQNPDTNDYILVQDNSINLANWNSGNEKIDDFIQEMQLKVNNIYDIVFEWIPYNQLDEVKEIDKNGSIIIYSAIRKDGPLYKKYWNDYKRDSSKNVALKCFQNSQDSIDFLINETKKYSINYKTCLALYGISQNPDTNDYILVQIVALKYLHNSQNSIDFLINEAKKYSTQILDRVIFALKYLHNSQNSIDFLINEAKKYYTKMLDKTMSIYKDGPIVVDDYYGMYKSRANINVFLKYLHNSQNYIEILTNEVRKLLTIALNYLHNSQNSVDSLINEAKKYLTKSWDGANNDIYGISQNPNTNNYILVLVWTNWLSWSRRPSDTARHQGREWQTEKFLTDTSCVTRWKIEPDLEKLNKIYSFKTDDLYNIVIIPLKISTI
ncbi:kinase-like domain-containing protein [Rhizophagus irregularis DAOM 181602=DAOM 197198]|nr:kinase-like domain-containing protein [Rhizophagus irregularis DAOM 181602=DAOM 197198]